MIKYNFLNNSLLLVSLNEAKVSISFDKNIEHPVVVYNDPISLSNELLYNGYLIIKFLNLKSHKFIINVIQKTKDISDFVLAIYGISYILSRKVECIIFDPILNNESIQFNKNTIFGIIEDKLLSVLHYSGQNISFDTFINYIKNKINHKRKQNKNTPTDIKKRRMSNLKFEVINLSSLLSYNNYLGLSISKAKNKDKNVKFYYFYDERDLHESYKIKTMLFGLMSDSITISILNAEFDPMIYIFTSLAKLFNWNNIFILFASFNILENKIDFFSYLTLAEKSKFDYEIGFIGKNKTFSFFELISKKFGLSFANLKNVLNISLNKKILFTSNESIKLYTKEINLNLINLTNIKEYLDNQNSISYSIMNNTLKLESDNSYDLNRFINNYIKTHYEGKIIEEVLDGFLVEFNNKRNKIILEFDKDLYVGKKVYLHKDTNGNFTINNANQTKH